MEWLDGMGHDQNALWTGIFKHLSRQICCRNSPCYLDL